ncbi:MAG: lipoate--protein ligase [Bacteroidales bacterium]|nr:lipoate--protein ligase [Bacteroidales bacterium]
MRIINRPQTDPYFNIAAEEYLLKSMDTDCFMLWKNDTSIIVGKHQNSMAEINHGWIHEHKVPVVRRISGGGTVFHDPGNLNYSFIATGARDKLVDFKKYMQPIIEVLNKLGLPARYEGKNDIRVNGLKVSGNAEHVYRNRVLHHGTLLFNAKLSWLNEAIRVNEKSYQDKAVKSIRSKVANIADLLENEISLENFQSLIIDHIQSGFPAVEFYNLTKKDILAIEKLANEKYKTWEWNFAYSPDYEFENVGTGIFQDWKVNLRVRKGWISEFILIKSEKNHPLSDFISTLLVGKKHNFAEVDSSLHSGEPMITHELRSQILKLLF